MIYLLGQMGLIILLAVLAGGAIGWIVQRFSTQQTVSDLRRLAAQQMQQVKQAQTDVAMVAQDYDELKQQSSATIDVLRKENQRIPQLDQNLEKSQLLVRQLMQKHEAQIREFASENELLKSKVKRLDDREKALNKLQADIDRSRKAQLSELAAAGAESANLKTAAETSKIDDVSEHIKAEPTGSADAAKTESSVANTSISDSAIASANTPAEKPKKTSQSIADLLAMAQARAQHEKEATAHLVEDVDADELVGLDGSADISGEAGSLTVALAEADDVLAAIDRRHEQARTLEDDEVIDTSDIDLNAEFADEEEELEQLFDSVDQHDDLQTIFGIGPITERGLNQLGITSYSQLADLKRHDIEKIANSLAIVPGKIEREDWVGNARRQLEDVLEEL